MFNFYGFRFNLYPVSCKNEFSFVSDSHQVPSASLAEGSHDVRCSVLAVR